MKRLLILAMTTAALLFTSCVNDVNNPDSTVVSGECIIEVGGSLKLSGALPAEFCHAELVSASRTAYPGIPAASSLTYTITAKNTEEGSTEVYTGTVSSDNNSYSVGIPVSDTAKNFKVYASVTQNGAEILSGVSTECTFSNSSRTRQNVNITLAPAQTSNKKGCFSLKVTAASDSGINSAKVVPEGESAVTATKSGNDFTFICGTVTEGVCNGIASKAYSSTFYFYSGTGCTGALLYSFTTTINIFDFMTTNTWIDNGNEPYFVTTTSAGVKTTTCQITKSMVDAFGITEIYVDSTKQTTDSSNTSTYTTAIGTFTNPVTTLSAAIAMLKNKDMDYKIWIKGTLTGNQSIGTSLKNDGTGTYNAKSLTLCGARGLSGENPQDVLDGNCEGTVLNIETVVPVTIKNLQITNGYGDVNDDEAGGIKINSGGDVTLDSGVLINFNVTSYCGAGVQNYGRLKIKDGVLIISNSAADYYGGGICNFGTVIMEGGEINSNSSALGGGVYNESKNGSKGVFIMSGGTIQSNSATSAGGAFYIKSGTFKISGSAYIPSGAVNGNVVKLQNNTSVTIDGQLTATAPVLKISPYSYTLGRTVVNRGSGINSDAEFKTQLGKMEIIATSQMAPAIVPERSQNRCKYGVIGVDLNSVTKNDLDWYTTNTSGFTWTTGGSETSWGDTTYFLLKTSSYTGILRLNNDNDMDLGDLYFEWVYFNTSGTNLTNYSSNTASVGYDYNDSYEGDSIITLDFLGAIARIIIYQYHSDLSMSFDNTIQWYKMQ